MAGISEIHAEDMGGQPLQRIIYPCSCKQVGRVEDWYRRGKQQAMHCQVYIINPKKAEEIIRGVEEVHRRTCTCHVQLAS